MRKREMDSVSTVLWAAVFALIMVAVMCGGSGCVVSKPVVNVTATDGHGRTRTTGEGAGATRAEGGGMTVVINAGAGVIEKAALTGDNVSTGTMTVAGESGGGGSGGWLASVWSYIVSWFGVSGSE